MFENVNFYSSSLRLGRIRVLGVQVTDGFALSWLLLLWVVLEQVVSDELERVLRASLAYFLECLHHRWGYRALEVHLRLESVDVQRGHAHDCLLLSFEALDRVLIATFGV